MSRETLNVLLTDEEVERAVKRVGVEHPLLALLEELTPQFQNYVKGRPKTDDNSVAQAYIRDNLGFFAEAVERTEGYNLEPLDIIALWSKATEMGMTNYDLYRVAETIGAKFASMGLSDPAWNGVVTKFFATVEFPEGALARNEDVATFRSRLNKINESIDTIDKYSIGSGPSMDEVIAATKAGKYVDLSNVHKKPYHDLLGRIQENFGNGLMLLYMKSDV